MMAKKSSRRRAPAAPGSRPSCGIVMPISECDGCTPQHWREVLELHTVACAAAGFDSQLVSASDISGVIHKRIIENLYRNEMVVCDVSGRNPNVMFELGMRLTFDKPVIVVKDDETDYSFDTTPIEHIVYPRTLHFQSMVRFQEELARKIKATFEESKKSGFSPFLRHFGNYDVAKLETQEVGFNEYVERQFAELKEAIQRIGSKQDESATGAWQSQMPLKQLREFNATQECCARIRILHSKGFTRVRAFEKLKGEYPMIVGLLPGLFDLWWIDENNPGMGNTTMATTTVPDPSA